MSGPAAAVSERDWLLAEGGRALSCHATVPVHDALARLVIVHGYGEHAGRYAEFVRWMAGRGVACYAFDFRGHGRSSGRRGYVRRWDEYLDDLRTFMGQPELRREGDAPLFLLAHSHGALVVILAAAVVGMRELDGIAGVVMTNPYLRNGVPVPVHRRMLAHVMNPVLPSLRFPSRVRPEWLSSDPRMQQETVSDPLGHRCATPRWFVTVRRAQQRAMDAAASFRLPMLMMLGLRDPVARPEACRAFYERAGSANKTLVTYPEMVHELLRESERERVFADAFDWIGRRIVKP